MIDRKYIKYQYKYSQLQLTKTEFTIFLISPLCQMTKKFH
jgi:hypothetical protein